MNIIAIDIASEVSAVCVLTASGRIRREERVPTRVSNFKRLIKEVPRPRQVVFEEGVQAAWLWSELSPICDDVFVCNPRQNRQLSGEFKSDSNDARNLGVRAHANLLKRVWHGGKELQALREAVRFYQCMTEQNVRVKNQISAVFRGRGIKGASGAYSARTRAGAVKLLPLAIQRERVQALGAVLDEVTARRAQALKRMVELARKNRMYKTIRLVDGMGPIFTSMFIAEVGDPRRFRTRSQLWAYSGLAVSTFESSEFELQGRQIVRKSRQAKTRGLVRSYNRTLKYIFKQAVQTLSRFKWAPYYQELLGRTKNTSNAQLTLARKFASVVLHVAKTGEKYDIAKVFKTASVSPSD